MSRLTIPCQNKRLDTVSVTGHTHRSSRVTRRSKPLDETVSVSGPIRVEAETFSLATDKAMQILDLTDDIMARVVRMGVREGTATLSSLHTTCVLFVNESQAALREDMEQE